MQLKPRYPWSWHFHFLSLPPISPSFSPASIYSFLHSVSLAASCVPWVCRVLGAQWCLAQISSPPEWSVYYNGQTHLLYSKANIFKHLEIVMRTWSFTAQNANPTCTSKLRGGASSPGASMERPSALQVWLRPRVPAGGTLGTEGFTSGTRGRCLEKFTGVRV